MRLALSSLGAVSASTLSTAQVQQMIVTAANQAGIPPSVALAVAQHESGFIPTAQNPSSSAAGVFQLISATQQTMGVTDPYNAQQNINAGVALLARYYQQYGNWNDALQAFGDGPATVGVQGPSLAVRQIQSMVGSGGVDAGPVQGELPVDVAGVGLPDASATTLMDWAMVAFTGVALLVAAKLFT